VRVEWLGIAMESSAVEERHPTSCLMGYGGADNELSWAVVLRATVVESLTHATKPDPPRARDPRAVDTAVHRCWSCLLCIGERDAPVVSRGDAGASLQARTGCFS